MMIMMMMVKGDLFSPHFPVKTTQGTRQLELGSNYILSFNTLMPRKNCRHFIGGIFLNANIRISFTISLKFVPMVGINNKQALGQMMAWRLQGDKP